MGYPHTDVLMILKLATMNEFMLCVVYDNFKAFVSFAVWIMNADVKKFGELSKGFL